MNEHIQIILGAMLFKDSPWSSEPRKQLRNKDVPEEHLHIVIFWNMAIDRCGHTVVFEWILKRCTPPRLMVEQRCTWRTFYIIILWNMAIKWWGYTNECNWMAKRCTPPRLIVGQCCSRRTSSYRYLRFTL